MSELRRRLMMQQVSGDEPILPPEYQQVEWIQSSGTQWIDLNFIPAANNNLVFDIEAEIISSGTLFGGRIPWDNRGLILNTLLNNPFLDYGNRNYFNVSFITPPRRNHFFVENHIFYIDDVNIAEIRNNITPPTMTVVLFSVRDGESVGGFVGAKMYHAYFYQPEVVNIDLYPCYRKSDNEAGMYDITNHVFYTNSGSGSFTVGPDVM